MKNILENFASKLYKEMEIDFKTVNINNVKNSDGRKNDALEVCKRGSFVYLLYDSNNKLLYVGETGISIKSRCFSDGSGAHKNKPWFNDVSYIKYYRKNNSDFSSFERKAIENALCILLKPKNNKKSK